MAFTLNIMGSHLKKLFQVEYNYGQKKKDVSWVVSSQYLKKKIIQVDAFFLIVSHLLIPTQIIKPSQPFPAKKVHP